MRKMLLRTLLKTYSYFLIVIMFFFASVLSWLNWQQHQEWINRSQEEVTTALASELSFYQSQIQGSLYDLSTDEDKIEGLNHYFEMSPASYQEWLFHHHLFLVKDISFFKTVQQLYRSLPFVTGIDIAPLNQDKVFVSTPLLKSGTLVDAERYKAPEQSFSVNVYEVGNGNLLGTFYFSIDSLALRDFIQSKMDYPLAVTITDSLDRIFYQQGQMISTDQVMTATSGDLTIQVALSRQTIQGEAKRLTILIFAVSSLLIGILLHALTRIFRRYQVQVRDLVDTMQLIKDQDRAIRIKTDDKQEEMYLISSGINDTLDSLDTSIRDVYRLELAQQDANMRALQAQINPHFLYNTLEFFRMYAVTKDMDELADMIYEFSTLLRGSISQKKEATIREELDFCEKHSYICQIRYPRSIAYSYQVETDCEEVTVPRFSIQPLVENYFAHGVDLKRKNNALSVKVLRHDSDMEILVRDNGKGMPEEVLRDYQQLLAQREHISQTERQSIGIINVHERFLLYFGDRYSIRLTSEKRLGVTYSIWIKDVFGKED